MQSITVKIFASETRISKPLRWPEDITVPTVYFRVCSAVSLTLGTLLDKCLNFISSNAAFSADTYKTILKTLQRYMST